MLKLVSIAVGGALGALSRYGLSGAVSRWTSASLFPYGTLYVNLIGCLCMGFLWGAFERFSVSLNTRLFIFVGFLGAFTTFSTFCHENFLLIRDSQWKPLIANIALSNVLGLICVAAGFWGAQALYASIRG